MTPTSLLRNPSISSHAVRLWSVLASYTYGDQATDRPSRAQLASDVGWKSPRSVDTYLTELQDAGYLTVAAAVATRRWEGPEPVHPRMGTPRPAPPRTADPPLWTALFPQVPHAQNPAMGVPDAGDVDNSSAAQDPCARSCAWGRLSRYPCAGSCAYP